MLDHVTYLYGFNLNYAERLVKDVSAEQMAAQPGGVINHVKRDRMSTRVQVATGSQRTRSRSTGCAQSQPESGNFDHEGTSSRFFSFVASKSLLARGRSFDPA